MELNISDTISSVGHHFIVGLEGTTLSESDKRILGTLQPAGILLLARNFDHTATYEDWIATYTTLIKQVHEYAEREKMIISIDHEGGRIHRVPEPFTRFPTAVHWKEHAGSVAKAMAKELKSLAVNVSWSPVTDIHSNPENPVIGERAFGTNPESVIEYARDYLDSQQAEGVLGSIKHFPGHGDTNVDSHKELPVLDTSLEELKHRELLPFQQLTQAAFVMTAHIKFPQIDPYYPATMSELILKNILIEQFNYDGVIVSDDLDMRAVSSAFCDDEAVACILSAGCSMLIASRQDPSSDKPLVLAQQIIKMLRCSKLTEGILAEHFDKIENLFQHKLKRYAVEQLDTSVFEEHGMLKRDIEESCS